jgi:hypothetical protein
VLLLEIPGRSNRDNWPVQLRNDSAKEKAYQNAAKMEGFETSAFTARAEKDEATNGTMPGVRAKLWRVQRGRYVGAGWSLRYLRINLCREYFGACGSEFEAQEPLVCDAFSICFGRSECPVLRGADCGIGEILAWAGSFERGVGHFA